MDPHFGHVRNMITINTMSPRKCLSVKQWAKVWFGSVYFGLMLSDPGNSYGHVGGGSFHLTTRIFLGEFDQRLHRFSLVTDKTLLESAEGRRMTV